MDEGIIQDNSGNDYHSSSYSELKFNDEKGFEKLGAKDQKGCKLL